MKKQRHNFVFPLFSSTSAALVLVFWWLPQWIPHLASRWLGGVGMVAVVMAVWLGWKGRLSSGRVYDLLLWGTLWLWLAGWLRVFAPDAPLFRAYPVYFILQDAFAGHFIIGQSIRWSAEERRILKILEAQWWFGERIVAGLVLIGLLMTQHYLIYPLAVGLLTVRRALSLALQEN